MAQIFSQIQQAPGPDFRKVGKSLWFDTYYTNTHILFWIIHKKFIVRCHPNDSLKMPPIQNILRPFQRIFF